MENIIDMFLDVSVENLTILGISFNDRKIFNCVWYALSTNMIEGWQPTVEDVKRLKEEALNFKNI
ncbi:hypothetical protein Si084_01680 [Streptococcus infantarius subsp. infantarius]|nr:hypothetical protein [Streptococcus infantarius subsp. infantarius]MCO4589164.1 hypothetical protein [Streptococcus infantarius subsp. infantarius]MCO4623434.1 hypothetical protein [Streptococcus infantarius subsp. infantarius]MCO4641788.1 hypothetical protein [Streptococcus infantarius subsp. infantarius]MCO4644338.1 hypothetical protein [Streptococcus infantarius subsp. infantarius]